MAYAPESLKWLAGEWDKAISSAVPSGIVGGPNHKRGYHRSINELPANDYSRQLAADRDGADPNAASAVDMSMNTADMKLVTKRFYDSWRNQNDMRLNYVREVIGTLDGKSVIYMDCQSGERGSADSSHLWHIHVGLLRKYATNFDAAKAVLSVVRGESYAQYLGTQETPKPAPNTNQEEGDNMGAWTGPFTIPKLDDGGHWTGPVNPVSAGVANPRQAWVNFGADTFGQDYYLRAWYSDGVGGWRPFPQSVTPGGEDAAQLGAGVFKFSNGQCRSFFLPAGTWIISVKRHPGSDGKTYDGFLSFGIEHGPVVH